MIIQQLVYSIRYVTSIMRLGCISPQQYGLQVAGMMMLETGAAAAGNIKPML